LSEGEEEELNIRSGNEERTLHKRKVVDADLDMCKPRKMRGKQVDYKYLHDPFPDKEEAGIVTVEKEEAFAVIPDEENCCTLHKAKDSLEWPK